MNRTTIDTALVIEDGEIAAEFVRDNRTQAELSDEQLRAAALACWVLDRGETGHSNLQRWIEGNDGTLTAETVRAAAAGSDAVALQQVAQWNDAEDLTGIYSLDVFVISTDTATASPEGPYVQAVDPVFGATITAHRGQLPGDSPNTLSITLDTAACPEDLRVRVSVNDGAVYDAVPETGARLDTATGKPVDTDAFVLVRGGRVDNDPDLPVIDADEIAAADGPALLEHLTRIWALVPTLAPGASRARLIRIIEDIEARLEHPRD